MKASYILVIILILQLPTATAQDQPILLLYDDAGSEFVAVQLASILNDLGEDVEIEQLFRHPIDRSLENNPDYLEIIIAEVNASSNIDGVGWLDSEFGFRIGWDLMHSDDPATLALTLEQDLIKGDMESGTILDPNGGFIPLFEFYEGFLSFDTWKDPTTFPARWLGYANSSYVMPDSLIYSDHNSQQPVLDPLQVDRIVADISFLYQPALLYRSPDNAFYWHLANKLTSGLLEGSQWNHTIEIQKNVQWEDGTPLTVNDIGFAIDVMNFHCIHSDNRHYNSIISYDIKDNHTISLYSNDTVPVFSGSEGYYFLHDLARITALPSHLLNTTLTTSYPDPELSYPISSSCDTPFYNPFESIEWQEYESNPLSYGPYKIIDGKTFVHYSDQLNTINPFLNGTSWAMDFGDQFEISVLRDSEVYPHLTENGGIAPQFSNPHDLSESNNVTRFNPEVIRSMVYTIPEVTAIESESVIEAIEILQDLNYSIGRGLSSIYNSNSLFHTPNVNNRTPYTIITSPVPIITEQTSSSSRLGKFSDVGIVVLTVITLVSTIKWINQSSKIFN